MWSGRLVQFVAVVGLASSGVAGCFDPDDSEPVAVSQESTGSTSGVGSGTSGPDMGTTSAITTEGGSVASEGVGETSTEDGGESAETTVDDTTGPEGSTGEETGVCAGNCAPEVPAGFSGPVLVYAGEGEASACPATAPAVAADLYADLQAPAAQCSCECGDAENVSCGAATLREHGNTCLQPIVNPDTWTLNPGACVPYASSSTALNVFAPTLQTAGGSCDPSFSQTIPETGWAQTVRLCDALVTDDACDADASCSSAPTDDFDRVCVYVEGEASCPEEGWTQRQVVHAEVVDDRGCSECSCGAPSGTCGGTVSLTQNSCGGGAVLVGSVNAGSCSAGLSTNGNRAQYVPEPQASCSPSGGAPTGTATPTGPVTLCCQG